MLAATFRPLSSWPGTRTKRRSRSPFSAPWSATLDLLERELRHLSARLIVVELDLTEADIRLDGWPRSGARPSDPGVVVSFESRYGPLRYSCDAFTDWAANLRAVALGLEALRRVDRYGITKRGEQYTGWKALPSGIAMGNGHGFASREEAAAFLIEHGEWGGENAAVEDILTADREVIRSYFREAAKKLHPDVGGDPEMFKRLQAARERIEL